jgi:hypothetical protein
MAARFRGDQKMADSTQVTSITEFLQFLQPASRFLLVTINPITDRVSARSFTDYAQAESWALAMNRAGDNCYYTMNLARDMEGKPKKENIIAARAYWVDIDPDVKTHDNYITARTYLIEELLPKVQAASPTIIVDSGNGIQAEWLLKHPIGLNGNFEDYESFNKRICVKFHGDLGTYNCDRLLRLPFTRNYPTATKLAKGYPDNPSTARVLECSDRRYTEIEIEVLCSTKFDKFLAGNPKARARWEGNTSGLNDTSGSGMDMSMLALLRLGGFDRDEVEELLRGWAYGSKNNRKHWAQYFDRMWRKVEASPPIAKAHVSMLSRLLTILRTDNEIAGFIRYNTLQCQYELRDEQLRDVHEIELREWVEGKHGLIVGKNCMADAINRAAEENSYDPLRDYLDSLKWDGENRITSWLADVYGAREDGDITAEFGKRWLIAGVARAYQPGAKVRSMLLLVGSEDIGKSMSLCDLCRDPAWFSDSLPSDLHSREAAEALLGKWIIESAELASIRRSQQEAVKAFLSRNHDNYRAPYERHPKRVPRRCILAGTTNEETPIPYTGEGSRYWPVRVIEYNQDYLLDIRDQLWAEAKVLYQAGQKWWIEDPKLLQAINEARDDFREENAMAGTLQPLLLGRDTITMSEILNDLLKVPIHQQETHGLRVNIGSAMQSLGFKKFRKGRGSTGYRPWFYSRS